MQKANTHEYFLFIWNTQNTLWFDRNHHSHLPHDQLFVILHPWTVSRLYSGPPSTPTNSLMTIFGSSCKDAGSNRRPSAHKTDALTNWAIIAKNYTQWGARTLDHTLTLTGVKGVRSTNWANWVCCNFIPTRGIEPRPHPWKGYILTVRLCGI